MKKTINFYNFRKEFYKAGREEEFTYNARKALFYNLKEYEEATGEEIELDVVALCCEYTEFENIEEFWEAYGQDGYPDIEAIEENTQVIMIDDEAFLILSF